MLLACSNCLGQDNVAYLVNFLGNTLWFFSVLIGTEDRRINYFYFGMLRGVVTVIASYILIKVSSLKEDVSQKDLSVLNRRNVIMTMQGFGLTFCLHYLESPIVYTIASAGPVLVYVVDYFTNGITITRKQLIGILLACVGIGLAINSHLLYKWFGIEETMASDFTYIEASLEKKLVVALFFLCIIIMWAYAIVVTKSLKGANVVHVNFHLGVILIAYNAIGLYCLPNPEQITFQLHWSVLLKVAIPMSLGSGLFIASLFLTKKSGNLTMVSFVTVFWSYLVSIVRYNETPNMLGVIGSICIAVGLALILLIK